MMRQKVWIWLFFLLGDSVLLSAQQCHIGDVITNPDGSKGVVFYVNDKGTGGWMVAMNDLSQGCAWGTAEDIPDLLNRNNNVSLLWQEVDGKENTRIIREYQGNNPNYAAGKVDYEHGWYVPAIGQLRILFSNLGLIQGVLTSNGGTTLSRTKEYWSSTEVNSNSAYTVNPNIMVSQLAGGGSFASHTKTASTYALRAVCDFSVLDYLWSTGETTDSIVVSPTETTTYTLTVLEGGLCSFSTQLQVTVFDIPAVTLTADDDELCVGESTTLHAVVQRASIGDILCTDGTFVHPDEWSSVQGKTAKGVVFYVDATGSHGWALDLNDLGTVQRSVTPNELRGLTPYGTPREAIKDVDGHRNTLAIRNTYKDSEIRFPAAFLMDLSQGWYLPAMGQLRYLYANHILVNQVLKLFNEANPVFDSNQSYMTSTSYDSQKLWELGSDGGVDNFSNTRETSKVRAVCTF